MYGDENKAQFIKFYFSGEQPVKDGDFKEALRENGMQYADYVPKSERVLTEYFGVRAENIRIVNVFAQRDRMGSGEPSWFMSEEQIHPGRKPDGYSVVGTVFFDDGTKEDDAEIACFSSKSLANKFVKQAE